MSIRVLIADHRMDQLMLLAEFLLRRGVSAATCTDGPQASEAIRSHCEVGEPYDLVIAHVDLPELPGLRLLYEARSRHLDTVAAVSCPHNRRDEQTETMIRKVGVTAVLDQPFDLMQIDGLVKKVLKARGQSTEQPDLPPPTDLSGPQQQRSSAVVYHDERRPERAPAAAAPLPDIESHRGPPRPSPTGNQPQVPRFQDDDDIALPAMGQVASTGPAPREAPVAQPARQATAEVEPGQRAAAYYDPASGGLVPEAGRTARTPSPLPGGEGSTGYARQPSAFLPPTPPETTSGEPAATGYTRRRSSEFFDPGVRKPASTTHRVRRSLSGSFGPPPSGNVETTCVHCGKAMTVKATGGLTQVPCLGCGQLNQIKT